MRARLACLVGYSNFAAPALLAFAVPPLLADVEGALGLPATLVLPVFAVEVLREGAFFAAALPAVASFVTLDAAFVAGFVEVDAFAADFAGALALDADFVADFAVGFADFAAVLRVRFLGSGPT